MQIELRCNTMVRDFKRHITKYESNYGRKLAIVGMNENTLTNFIRQCTKAYHGEQQVSEELVRNVINGRNSVSCEQVYIIPDKYVENGYMEDYEYGITTET